jgi:hypothetical protein
VCDQETSENEEAKVRYWAVKIQPQWVVTAGKQILTLVEASDVQLNVFFTGSFVFRPT